MKMVPNGGEVSCLLLAALIVATEGCLRDTLATYRITLATHWTRDRFPKQYPEWRPRAQWSKLYGISHDNTEKLWREGEEASEGLGDFAEAGTCEGLETEHSGRDAVLDEFRAPAIDTGAGTTTARFFADSNHTLVSAIVKIVPSPDWFVGLDSVNLCSNGQWVKSLTIKAYPLDSGTDNGFTFSSPNWKTEPKQIIRNITSKFPNHPASSFFYPDRESLPTIAVFRLIQEKIYALQVMNVTSSKEEIIVHTEVLGEESLFKAHSKVNTNEVLPHNAKIQEKRKHRGKGKISNRKRPVPCRASEWGPWSPCSKSCGIGEMKRTRKVLRIARRGGQPCPPLTQVSRCSRDINCSLNYFRWS